MRNKKMVVGLLLGCFWAGAVMAQAPPVVRQTAGGGIDFGAMTSTRPNRVGVTLPATCAAGETFVLTVAAPAQQYHLCTATNTWTVQGAEAVTSWGVITGTLANQTDLQTALDAKANTSHTHGVGDITASGTPSSSTYLRGDGAWATPAGSGLDPMNSSVYTYVDEFLRVTAGGTSVGSLPWQSTGTVEQLNQFPERPGILQLSTTAVLDNVASLFPHTSGGTFPVFGQVTRLGNRMEAWVMLPAVTDLRFQFGYPSNAAQGQYIYYDSASGPNWQCRSEGASSANTNHDLGTAVAANTWYLIKLYSDTAGSFRCQVGNGTPSPNISGPANWVGHIGFRLQTRSANIRSFQLDWIGIQLHSHR